MSSDLVLMHQILMLMGKILDCDRSVYILTMSWYSIHAAAKNQLIVISVIDKWRIKK